VDANSRIMDTFRWDWIVDINSIKNTRVDRGKALKDTGHPLKNSLEAFNEATKKVTALIDMIQKSTGDWLPVSGGTI
jgi:hypothetical protein